VNNETYGKIIKRGDCAMYKKSKVIWRKKGGPRSASLSDRGGRLLKERIGRNLVCVRPDIEPGLRSRICVVFKSCTKLFKAEAVIGCK
jgi:hypothetical protein